MPEQKILTCRPVSPPGYVVPGSLPSECSQCGKPVWISPSSWLLLHDNPEMVIRCISCAFADMEKHGGTIEDLTPAQREETEEGMKGREIK